MLAVQVTLHYICKQAVTVTINQGLLFLSTYSSSFQEDNFLFSNNGHYLVPYLAGLHVSL